MTDLNIELLPWQQEVMEDNKVIPNPEQYHVVMLELELTSLHLTQVTIHLNCRMPLLEMNIDLFFNIMHC